MRIRVIGHGMVGHKFLEEIYQLGIPDLAVTVLCEEPRPAYDRVHLSDFFSGKSAQDLSLVSPHFFADTGATLCLNTKAIAINRREKSVTIQNGQCLPYDKLVLDNSEYIISIIWY